MDNRAQFHLFKRYDLSRDKLRAAVQSDPAVRAEAEAECQALQYFRPGQKGFGRSTVAAEYLAILKEALS